MLNKKKWILAMWLHHTEKLDLCVDLHLCIWVQFVFARVCHYKNVCASVGFLQSKCFHLLGGRTHTDMSRLIACMTVRI